MGVSNRVQKFAKHSPLKFGKAQNV